MTAMTADPVHPDIPGNPQPAGPPGTDPHSEPVPGDTPDVGDPSDPDPSDPYNT